MARRPPPNGVPRGYLGNALHAHCTGRFGLVVVHNGGRPHDSMGLRWPGASSAHLVRRQRHERAPFASHNTARVRAHRGRAPRLPQLRPDGPAPGGIIEVQPWSGRYFSLAYERNIKAISFINTDFTRYPFLVEAGWQDARLQNNETVAKAWFMETAKDRYLKQSPQLFGQLGFSP